LEKNLKRTISFIKKHKILFLTALIIILVIGGVFYTFIGRMMGFSRMTGYESNYASGIYAPMEDLSYKSSYEQEVDEKASELLSNPSEYQIKRGSSSIKSAKVESDYETIHHKTTSLNGWVESMTKNEDYSRLSITANLKIPFENFDSFADWLMDNFDVKNANLQLYKMSVEKQQDEIEILLEALDVYDRLLERAEKMNVTESNIEIIMKITERRLDVMRLLRQYGYSVEQVEKQAKHASLSIIITQEKKIKLIPENLGQELRTKIRNSIRNIANAGMDLITVPIVLLTKIILWILYAIVVLIPVFITYKVLMKIFKRIGRKI